MVTVIRRNNFTCTCPKCNSELAYSYDEIQEHRINHDYLGDFDIVHGIVCPICKSIIKAK
jgi:uncharacterized protein with PIN domain